MRPSRETESAGKEGGAQPEKYPDTPLANASRSKPGPRTTPHADTTGAKRSENDAVLVSSARAGSREAFQQLYAKYFRLVMVLLYQKVPQLSDVEDLAQETFFRAWRGLPNLRKPHRFLPWLLRIARRLVADWHRAAAREPNTTAHTLDAMARYEDPGRQLERAEDRANVLQALEKLPDRYQLVLTLRFLEGLTPHGIAERLGEPSGTIRNRIFRGLAKLSKLVDPESQDGR